MTRYIAVALLVLLAACGGSPTAPDNLNGTWGGGITSNYNGSGTATMTVSATGSTVSGNWSVTFPGYVDSGILSGTTSGSALDVRMTPSQPSTCPYQATATIRNGTMTGTYAAFNCSISVNGSFTLTRR